MKKEDETTPISNYFSGLECSDPQFDWHKGRDLQSIWVIEYLNLRQDKLKTSIVIHKEKLGKQKYCIIISNKNWVWEGDNWRVYVSVRGVGFEIKIGLTLKDACEAWANYYQKITGEVSQCQLC